MTKMYIDYAVVKQALEALEDVDGPITALLGSLLGSPDADAPGAKVRTAITALRDALAQQAEPVEPVAWECKAGGLKPLTQRQYDAQTVATKRHYTRIAPPQRTMAPLTEDEIYHATRHCGVSKYTAINITRAVEQAHGIKE